MSVPRPGDPPRYVRPQYISYSVTAASGPAGQNLDGLANVYVRGAPDGEQRVTCLKVETVNYTVRAAIGVVGVRGTRFGGPGEPYSALYTVSKTLFEPNRFQIREQSPPDCAHADFSNLIDSSFPLTIRDVP